MNQISEDILTERQKQNSVLSDLCSENRLVINVCGKPENGRLGRTFVNHWGKFYGSEFLYFRSQKKFSLKSQEFFTANFFFRNSQVTFFHSRGKM